MSRRRRHAQEPGCATEQDLLKDKKASARSKDLIDVDELERIEQTTPADRK
ncbi:MAG TPA: hypothetical protein VKA43_15850 [Gammaproteobacteria bacterium]|nr:hypothetical protein [Gammaproteobacteria bacterium]